MRNSLPRETLLLFATGPGIALGQDDAVRTETAVLDEIVVTARRREERLQYISMAVAAPGRQQLDERQLVSHNSFVAGGMRTDLPGFDPESVRTWEVGGKSDLLRDRLRINVAFYDAENHHIQLGADLTDPDGPVVFAKQIGGRAEYGAASGKPRD